MKPILYLLFALLYKESLAQNNTLFFLPNLPQSAMLNPAKACEFKTIIGLPVLSMLSASYNNSSFGYNTIFTKRNDSLIFEPNTFISKLHKYNYIQFQTEIALFSLYRKINDIVYGFDIENKTEIRTGFTKDLLSFGINGNENSCELKLGLYGKIQNYNQISFSISKEITPNLRGGLRIKYLQGVADVAAHPFQIDLKTGKAPVYSLAMKGELNARVSFPVKVEYDSTGIPNNVEERNINIVRDFIFNKNRGLALDVGIVYQLSNKIELEASLNDLGFIRWKRNTSSASLAVENQFSGVDITNVYSKNDTTNFGQYMEQKFEEYKKTFQFKNSTNPYFTNQTPAINLAASYKISESLKANFLCCTEIFNNRLHPTATLSALYNPSKSVSLSISASAMNYTFLNLGFGFALKLGFAQFYFATDKIPFFYTKIDNFTIPYSSRSLKFQNRNKSDIQQKENTAQPKIRRTPTAHEMRSLQRCKMIFCIKIFLKIYLFLLLE